MWQSEMCARRRRAAGRPLARVLLFGDTDVGADRSEAEDEFARDPRAIVREMVSGGVSLSWPLALSAAIGVWLMFTRLTLGDEGAIMS
jgi:hypothetical protein